MKRRILFMIFLIAVMAVGCVVGGIHTKQKVEKEKEIAQDWNSVLNISYGELREEILIDALRGNSDYSVENYDFSFVVEQMEMYSDKCEFTNLGVLMCSAGVEVSDVNDSQKCYEEFVKLTANEKNNVLSHMLIKCGESEQTIKYDYDYVPTGEKTMTGEDITEYRATITKKIKYNVYSLALPLEVKAK